MKSDWHFIRFVPVILVMAAIFTLSHQHGSRLHLPAIPYIDKVGHFTLYFLLAGTVLYAVPATLRHRFLWKTAAYVVIFCLGYGLSDELHQMFIPGRDASIADLIADLIGAATLTFLWFRKKSLQSSRIGNTQMDDSIPYRY